MLQGFRVLIGSFGLWQIGLLISGEDKAKNGNR